MPDSEYLTPKRKSSGRAGQYAFVAGITANRWAPRLCRPAPARLFGRCRAHDALSDFDIRPQ